MKPTNPLSSGELPSEPYSDEILAFLHLAVNNGGGFDFPASVAAADATQPSEMVVTLGLMAVRAYKAGGRLRKSYSLTPAGWAVVGMDNPFPHQPEIRRADVFGLLGRLLARR